MPRYKVAVPEIHVRYYLVEAVNKVSAARKAGKGRGSLIESESDSKIGLLGPNENVKSSDYYLVEKMCREPEVDMQLAFDFNS